MAKNTEIELKLLLSKEELERLLTLDFMVQAIRDGSRRVRHLVSTYYDTQELTLKEHGIAYRVRDKGDGSFEATVKTQKQSAGGLSERLELNLPLAEAQRITYILDYAGAVCELAIDKGAIHCGEKSDSIDEVEIELLEGEVQALLELKERIAAAVTLRAEERSKFARGLALLQ